MKSLLFYRSWLGCYLASTVRHTVMAYETIRDFEAVNFYEIRAHCSPHNESEYVRVACGGSYIMIGGQSRLREPRSTKYLRGMSVFIINISPLLYPACLDLELLLLLLLASRMRLKAFSLSFTPGIE